jgi:hypothetical protein
MRLASSSDDGKCVIRVKARPSMLTKWCRPVSESATATVV